MKYYFVIGIICLIAVVNCISCKKNDDSPIFIIGDSTQVYIDYLDTVIKTISLDQHLTYNTDVDKDGIDDFRISSSSIQNSAYNYKVEIICLNNQSFVKSNTISDTIFERKYSSEIINSEGIKETDVYIESTYYRTLESYPKGEIKDFTYAVPYKRNQELTNNNWQSGTFTLTQSASSYTTEESGPGWIKRTNHYSEFHNIFPEQQIRYIGIKKVVRGTEKLGWIKLMIVNQNTLLVLEVALQK